MNAMVRVEVRQQEDGRWMVEVNSKLGLPFSSKDEAMWTADGLVRALSSSQVTVVSSSFSVDDVLMREPTKKEKAEARLRIHAGKLLKAAWAAYRLFPGLMPSGNYSGKKRERQFERIEEVHGLLHDAIAATEGKDAQVETPPGE